MDELGSSAEMTAADTRPAAVVAYCPVASMHEAKRWPGREAHPKLMPAPEEAAPELYRAASIEDRIDGSEPPVIFLHGDTDDLIPLAETAELAERIVAAGGRAEVARIEGAPHGFGYGVNTGHQKAALAHAERFLAGTL